MISKTGIKQVSCVRAAFLKAVEVLRFLRKWARERLSLMNLNYILGIFLFLFEARLLSSTGSSEMNSMETSAISLK